MEKNKPDFTAMGAISEKTSTPPDCFLGINPQWKNQRLLGSRLKVPVADLCSLQSEIDCRHEKACQGGERAEVKEKDSKVSGRDQRKTNEILGGGEKSEL
ncbi:hypothetical protein TNCV_3333051 [Trichonephila clavipes]|nr:hypothetical protein TNCV_3333051 [Trichonephila clavipes]